MRWCTEMPTVQEVLTVSLPRPVNTGGPRSARLHLGQGPAAGSNLLGSPDAPKRKRLWSDANTSGSRGMGILVEDTAAQVLTAHGSPSPRALLAAESARAGFLPPKPEGVTRWRGEEA